MLIAILICVLVSLVITSIYLMILNNRIGQKKSIVATTVHPLPINNVYSMVGYIQFDLNNNMILSVIKASDALQLLSDIKTSLIKSVLLNNIMFNVLILDENLRTNACELPSTKCLDAYQENMMVALVVFNLSPLNVSEANTSWRATDINTMAVFHVMGCDA